MGCLGGRSSGPWRCWACSKYFLPQSWDRLVTDESAPWAIQLDPEGFLCRPSQPSPPLCVVRLWVRSCCVSLPGERGAELPPAVEMGWAWRGEGRGRRAVGQHSGLRADAAQRGPSGMPPFQALAWYTTSSMEIFITGCALVVCHCHQIPDMEPKGWTDLFRFRVGEDTVHLVGQCVAELTVAGTCGQDSSRCMLGSRDFRLKSGPAVTSGRSDP